MLPLSFSDGQSHLTEPFVAEKLKKIYHTVPYGPRENFMLGCWRIGVPYHSDDRLGGVQMSTMGPAFPHRSALAKAISAAVASTTAAPVAVAQEEDGAGQRQLEEIIVTARKRGENTQHVPQAVLSFDASAIEKLGVRNMMDLAGFVPSMTVVSEGGVSNKVVFRGLADSISPFIIESSAAVYLDEQPLTTGSRTPDIRPVDLERVEALAGPQGTLFGASSQSGTLRYIVAKPDPSAFDASFSGGAHQISDGDLGWETDLMLNVPIVKDQLGVRLVGFAAEDAGFIDNVAGVTPYGGSKSNAAVVGEDINDNEWYGGRISAKWFMNDKWAVTGIYNTQNLQTHGFNDFDRSVGDLETIKFVDELREDSWHNFQFTLEGELGSAQLTSSTSYFERDIAYVFDASNSMAYYHAALGAFGRGTCGSDAFTGYYAAYNLYDFATACELNGFGFDVDDGDPIAWFRHDQKDERWTHETRLSSSNSKLDWTLGFFYQESDQHWEAGTYVEDFERTEAWAQFQAAEEFYGRPPLEPTLIKWQNGEKSTRKDMAVFGEATLSLNEHWKVLAGARWYSASVDREYFDRVPATHPVPTFVIGESDEDGWLPKIGFQYFIDDERMFYALYSEGFRLGGVNRDRAEQRGLVPTFPREYDSDVLQNWESGFRSRWLDGRVQLNATIYHQVWKDTQLEMIDPQNSTLIDTNGDGEGDTRYPFQVVVANLGDGIVDGIDLDISAVIGNSWSTGLVATYLFKAEIDEDVIVPNPSDPTDDPFFIAGGSRLPLTPDFQFAAYLEYDWQMGEGNGFARLQYSYAGKSWNQISDADGIEDGDGYGARVQNPSYSIVDLRTGYAIGDWELSVYLDNILDERAETFRSFGPETIFGRGEAVYTTRPRTFGIGVRKSFR